MSDVFRLDAISITKLPQRVQSDPAAPETTIINAVLHASPLPAHQYMEVAVNGVVQEGVVEGKQMVFTWQWRKATDEASIKLFRRGMLVRHWRGCWNERDAIVHLGTLPVQVFFNGKPQPLVKAVGTITSTATLAALSPEPKVIGGNGHSAVVAELEDSLPGAAGRANEQDNRTETVIAQDLLVLPESSSDTVMQPSDHEETVDAVEEVGTEQLDEENAAKPDVVVGNEREDQMVSNEEPETFEKQEEPGARSERPDVGPCLIPFHINTLNDEATLAELQALLSRMPKTILVDLRHHPRATRKTSGQRGLSKEHLRAVFGGTYWDRGWAIQTQSYYDTADRVPRLRQVVVHPDQNPDGIPSLVKQLQAGYSLVVMDTRAVYAESPRRAVIEELQKRLPDVVVGPVEVSQESVEVH